jgi:menaquinone-dependent protoporphyrinogen oxidase
MIGPAVTRVLVCAAGKHNATMEIAVEIADRIEHVLGPGQVDVRGAGQVGSLERYRAVVIGSAVYSGHWRPEALHLVRANVDAVRDKDVWLFSSGPVGDPPVRDTPPAEVDELMRLTHAHEHVVFEGKLDPNLLTWPQRVVVAALRVKPGDHRDWPRIDQWARDIGHCLASAVQREM